MEKAINVQVTDCVLPSGPPGLKISLQLIMVVEIANNYYQVPLSFDNDYTN